MNVLPFEWLIFEGGDPGVRQAALGVFAKLRDFPVCSMRNAMRHLADSVDEPLLLYASTLSAEHPCRAMAGFGAPLSGVVAQCGLEATANALRLLLRQSELTVGVESVSASTVKSIVGLLFFLSCKCVEKPCSEEHEMRSALQARMFCRFCGEKTEVGAYFSGTLARQLEATDRLDRLSSQFCVRHTAQLPDGSWNPIYKHARRNRLRFDSEVARLVTAAAHPEILPDGSAAMLADLYVYNVVRINGTYPDELRALRNLARDWIEAGLTDKKKAILMLYASNRTQTQIAENLQCSQQAVSRQLKSVPRVFFLETLLMRQAFQRDLPHAGAYSA